MKEIIATALLVLSLANMSGTYNPLMKAQTIPKGDLPLISIAEIKPTRERVQALHESDKANFPEIPESSGNKSDVPTSSTCKKTLKVLATAYCGCYECCGKEDHITATGTRATEGRTIAVDSRMIPYGTHVIINGHEYVAEDCGGDIQNNRIDIYFEGHEAARIWGKQYVTVEVIE